MKLPYGKVSIDILRKYVLNSKGFSSEDVIIGPSVGVDFAVIKLDGKYLIVSSDPITGVEDEIGLYAVNISANDVATSGNRPQFLSTVVLLPEGCEEKKIKKIINQIDETAKSLKITIVGGHTEVTPGLKHTIVATTAFSISEKYVTARDAKEGDIIIMTKTAGIEGTSILAKEFEDRLNISKRMIRKASNMSKLISIVEDATVMFNTGEVHAMHDPTEGGVIGGIYEMSLASNVGFKINSKDIPISEETSNICTSLGIDPIRIISSGALLASVDPSGVKVVLDELERHNIIGTAIGTFGGRRREIVRPDGSIESARPINLDEIWRFY